MALSPIHPEFLPPQSGFDVVVDDAQAYVDGVREQQTLTNEHYGRGYVLRDDYRGYFFEPFLPTPIMSGETPESRDDVVLTGRLQLEFNARAALRDAYPSILWDALDAIPNAIGNAACDMAVTLTFSALNRPTNLTQRIRGWFERKVMGQEPQTQAIIRRIGSIAADEA